MDQSPTKTCPIDFDQHTLDHAKRYPEIYEKMRTECPRAWTEAYGAVVGLMLDRAPIAA